MLRLDLFKSRNFRVGNVETLALYGGLSALFFFLVLFLQQVARYTPLQSGLALLPESVVMFALSSRFGAMADRLGPRLFMGLGPLVAGGGMLMLLTVGVHVSYLTTVLPAILVFSLGLSMTVAPLTATVLAGVSESEAGIGSAVNNAVARVAGLIATVTVGALVAAQFSSSLDQSLQGRPLTMAGQAAVAEAKRLTLGRPSVAGLPAAGGRRDHRRLEHRLTRSLPRGDRGLGRSGDSRRADRRRLDPQSPPRRACRTVRRRSARRGTRGRGRTARRDARLVEQAERRARPMSDYWKMFRRTTARSPGLLFGALAAGVALAGCGGLLPTATTTNTTTKSTPTVAATDTTSAGHGSSTQGGSHEPLPKPTTPEEKHEYDANEVRCRDDGGTIRDVGTIDAYCSFPTPTDDFHLIESSQKAPTEEEE